jgi:hypothetical protein
MCYAYKPHVHPERMDRIPKASIVFACGNSDVTFCHRSWLQAILDKAASRAGQTFYFQSKNPSCFGGLAISGNIVLVTTLETDIDQLYRAEVSKTAPLPSERYKQFYNLSHTRKVVTVEPVMEFTKGFPYAIRALKPEAVWVGYNTRPARVKLTEPPLYKTLRMIEYLRQAGIEVKEKDLQRSPTEGCQ